MAMPVSQLIVHLLFAALLPPLMFGIVNRTKAWFGGRTGPPLMQLYFDLFKLMQKGSVFSQTTTVLFRIGPVIGLVAVGLVSLFVPLGGFALPAGHEPHDLHSSIAVAPLSFHGDVILFAYLLALARFFTIIAALDTGSAFEGMGAAREATFGAMAEPILFFGLLVLTKANVLATGELRLESLLGRSVAEIWGVPGAAILLVVVSWFALLLVENCRIPFDDPNTHLELTMIHEVMVLDHSGPCFGLIMYTASLKLFVFGAMIVRLLVPMQHGWANWGLLLGGLLFVAVAVGTVESVLARFRLISVPRMLIGAGVIAAFSLVLIVSQS